MKNNYIKQKRKDQNPVNHWKIFEGRLVFLLAMVILVVVAYTFILQQAYTQTALKTEIERDISSADAVHKLVNNRLGRKDFNEIKDNQKFYIVDDTIVIFFDLYDIAPYVAGIPEFPINKEIISNLLNNQYKEIIFFKE